MNSHFATNYLPNYNTLPPEIKNIIFSDHDFLMIHSVNQKCREVFKEALQMEEEQKLGLYQKSLLLEGMTLISDLEDIKNKKRLKTIHQEYFDKQHYFFGEDKWNKTVWDLYCNVLDNMEKNKKGKSWSLLKTLSIGNEGASIAIKALKLFDKGLDNRMSYFKRSNLCSTSYKIKSEQAIYFAVGGKEKFHLLKIFEEASESLDLGCSVMRGINKREVDHYPFIAIQYKNPLMDNKIDIAFFYCILGLDSSGEDFGNWSFNGNMEREDAGLLSKHSSLYVIIDKWPIQYTYQCEFDKNTEFRFLSTSFCLAHPWVAPLHQLFTTGHCPVYPEDPTGPQYELVTENPFVA